MNAKKKQKKIEKKKKKRKFRKKSLGANLQSRNKASSYAKFPFHECLVPNGLFETGLGNIMVTRRTSDGSIAISAFIVDVYCLGVKNALSSVSSEHDYEHKIKSRIIETHEDQQFENVHPACARKLIEGAISYAKELGFYPHRDYKDAKGILEI